MNRKANEDGIPEELKKEYQEAIKWLNGENDMDGNTDYVEFNECLKKINEAAEVVYNNDQYQGKDVNEIYKNAQEGIYENG